MSLIHRTRERQDNGFPRVSGDEPGYITVALGVISFSPRERG